MIITAKPAPIMMHAITPGSITVLPVSLSVSPTSAASDLFRKSAMCDGKFDATFAANLHRP